MIKVIGLIVLLSEAAFGAELSLQDVMLKVEGQNYEVRAAREQQNAVQHAYEAASGKFYPKIDLETRVTHLNDEISLDLSPIRSAIVSSSAAAAGATGGPAVGGAVAAGLNSGLPAFDLKVQKQDYFNAALTITQALYTGGKISAARNAKFSELKSSELNTEDTRDRLLVTAAQAYFSVGLTKDALAVRKEFRDRLANHQTMSVKLLGQGQITKVAKMNSDVKLAEAEAELLRAEHEHHMAWTQLSNLMNERLVGAKLTTDLKISEEANDLAYYLERSSTRNRTLLAVDHKIDMIEAKFAAVRAEHLPTAFAFGRYELYKHDLTATEPEWYIGVGVKFNIFSGGEVQSNMAQVRSEQQAARYMQDSGKQNLELGVQKFYTDLRIASDQYRTLQSTLSLAESSVELSTNSYENGVLRSLDVIDAYAMLATVKLARLKALYDYNVALFQLKKLCGDAGDLLYSTDRGQK